MRCSIGKVFSLVLVVTAVVLTATLLSDFHRTFNHHLTIKGAKLLRHNAKSPLHGDIVILNQSVVDQVSTFVMFIGYPRSGHSIVGSCLDAHPDAMVAHEFNVLNKLMPPTGPRLKNRNVLFSSLCQNSFHHSLYGWRSSGQTLDKKGYTLKISSNSSWQGRFRQLKVIGDKSGGLTTHYYRDSPESFISAYKELTKVVQVPVKFIHVVRNPYDIIATKLLYRNSNRKGKKGNFTAENPVTNERQILQAARSLGAEVKAVQESVERLELVILEVHNVDFIRHTRKTMTKICQFLDLEYTESYLKLCDDAAYDHPSKSREKVAWTDNVREYVDQLIRDYAFFARYSFTTD